MGKRSFPPAWVSFLLDKHYTRQANSLTTQLEISTLKCKGTHRLHTTFWVSWSQSPS